MVFQKFFQKFFLKPKVQKTGEGLLYRDRRGHQDVELSFYGKGLSLPDSLATLEPIHPGEAQQGMSASMMGVWESIRQAAPTAAANIAFHSQTHMVVKVSGELAPAKDVLGGFRGFSTAGGLIKENAILFDPSKLATVLTGAAVWQIASIIVAQKHLADISASLRRVESKVDELQKYLEADRLAMLRSRYMYLLDLHATASRFGLPEEARGKLEDLDIEFAQIVLSIAAQIQREVDAVISEARIGTQKTTNEAMAKYQKVDRLVGELAFSLEAWTSTLMLKSAHTLGGASDCFLLSRVESTRKIVDDVERLLDRLRHTATNDIGKIDSWFNTASTLVERRRSVSDIVKGAEELTETTIRRSLAALEETVAIAKGHDVAHTIVVTLDNGQPTQIAIAPFTQEAPKLLA